MPMVNLKLLRCGLCPLAFSRLQFAKNTPGGPGRVQLYMWCFMVGYKRHRAPRVFGDQKSPKTPEPGGVKGIRSQHWSGIDTNSACILEDHTPNSQPQSDFRHVDL